MRHALLGLVALAVLGACGRGLPEPSADERTARQSAEALGPDPSPGCRPGELRAAHGERRVLRRGDEPRSYIVDAPGGPADRPRPLVLSFHGFQGSAWRHRWWTGLGRVADREGFIAVAPEGHEGVALIGTTGRGWDFRPGESRDVEFVRAVLDTLEAERCVDRRREFATGMSNGGFFANLLGCVLADRLAAIAPVSGAMPLEACSPARPVPVLFMYGSADRVVPPRMIQAARDWWAEIDGCGAPLADAAGCLHFRGCAAEVISCEGTHGHWWPADGSERAWRFFAAHPRGSRAP